MIGLIVAANILKLGVFPLFALVSGETVILVDVVLVVVVVVAVVVDAVVLFVVVVTALTALRLSRGALDDWDLNTSAGGLVRGLLVEITLGSARCLVSVLT